MGLEVRYHLIDDLVIDIPGASDEEIGRMKKYAAAVRKRRFSFTSLCRHARRKSIFCGVTNTGGNILHEFNPATGKFRSCGFQKHVEANEHKIHKGLWLDKTADALYFGTATLSDIPQLVKAPGGRLVRYDIATRRFNFLGTPVPNSYIQAVTCDLRRQLMYSFGIWDFGFAVWSLAKKKLVRAHAMGSIVHATDLDDAGGIWGTWGAGRHAFFRYDPDQNEFQCPDGCALPTAKQAANLMYPGAGPVDSLINGRDGFMYIGSAMGELYRLDPRTFEIVYLGRPFPATRMPGLRVGDDGALYGAGGDAHQTGIFRYDRATRGFDILGTLVAPDGKRCYRPHDMVMVGRTAYVGETDHPTRSGYLWECRF